jgi:hypothetical protein
MSVRPRPRIHIATRWIAILWIFAGLILSTAATPVTAAEATSQPATSTVETEDGEEEPKKKRKKSFPVIPIPIFVTEPAIGYGLGAAVGYFHERKSDEESNAEGIAPAYTTGTPPGSGRGKESKRPPTITGVAAAYTDKGTWAAGVGHSASWKRDTIRYQGMLAYANINSTFFFLNTPFDFNLKGGILYQNIRFRLGKGNFFLGGKLSYFNAEGEFTLGEGAPDGFLERDVADGGLAFQAVWDTRDNTMTPDDGQYFEAVLWRYDDVLGGEYNYWKGQFKLLSFHQFAKQFVLGFRLDVDAVDGEPPLWAYPWISIRGIPALRYQNEVAGVIETELRWNIFERWAVLGFIGVGATRGDTRRYEDESGIVAGGVGGRWLFRPEDSLWVGVDIATGPEDTYAYIQVGHAW